MFWALKNPNLSWTSEIVPIKQSMSVIVSLFSVWGYAAAFGIVFVPIGLFTGSTVCLIAVTVINLIFSALLFRWLKRKGSARYEAI